MGWAPGNARSHVARLTREQWLGRVARPRGEGSLFFATRLGVGVAGVDVPPAPPPAPTWWRHLEACAWVAAWLTAREREMLGPRELLVRQAWRGELLGLPGPRELVHRPISSASSRAAARPRSRSSSGASRRPACARSWDCTRDGSRLASLGRACTCAATKRYARLVLGQAALAGLDPEDGSLRIELLETIKQVALEASESVPRGTRLAGAVR